MKVMEDNVWEYPFGDLDDDDEMFFFPPARIRPPQTYSSARFEFPL